jgi:hypothetical protein
MATTFNTSSAKVAYNCRKAKRDGTEITVAIEVRGRPREITGRVLDVVLNPSAEQGLIWEITIAETRDRK